MCIIYILTERLFVLVLQPKRKIFTIKNIIFKSEKRFFTFKKGSLKSKSGHLNQIYFFFIAKKILLVCKTNTTLKKATMPPTTGFCYIKRYFVNAPYIKTNVSHWRYFWYILLTTLVTVSLNRFINRILHKKIK